MNETDRTLIMQHNSVNTAADGSIYNSVGPAASDPSIIVDAGSNPADTVSKRKKDRDEGKLVEQRNMSLGLAPQAATQVTYHTGLVRSLSPSGNRPQSYKASKLNHDSTNVQQVELVQKR